MKNKKYLNTTFESFNEAYVDKDGNLKDMDFSPSSNDLWSDEEFKQIVISGIEEDETEMPIEMYNDISDEHKKIYIEYLLNDAFLIFDTMNVELVKDTVKWFYDELKTAIENWIKMYSSFGNDHLPFSIVFMENIDTNLQFFILQKLDSIMDWEIILTEEEYNSFSQEAKDFINRNTESFTIQK